MESSTLMSDWGLSEFLNEIFRGSRVHVAALAESTSDERQNAIRVLNEWDQIYRENLPDNVPPFCETTAVWGAECFYRACQYLVFRDCSAEAINAGLTIARPKAVESPCMAYNVDLTWRFLPDLLKLASGLASDDPLVTQLRRWAVEWPLSSVGVPNLGEVDVSGFLDDPCLRCLYVDRGIARRDRTRQTNERVCAAVRETLGAFPELAPEISAWLPPKG